MLSSALSLLFLSSGGRHHRALHSFPTRRSSDLCFGRNDLQKVAFKLHPELYRLHHYLNIHGVNSSSDAICKRSEEHTSELQSRGQLVCRLLLEKKKRESRSDTTMAMNPAESPTA